MHLFYDLFMVAVFFQHLPFYIYLFGHCQATTVVSKINFCFLFILDSCRDMFWLIGMGSIFGIYLIG